MYLFARSRIANPAHWRKAVTTSVEICNRARDISGLDVSVWSSIMSGEAGLITWTAPVERLSDVQGATEKLATDTQFGDMLEQNDQLFVGPLNDALSQVVSGAPDPGTAPPAYVAVVQAACANGQVAAGMAAGVEIAEAATRLGGLRTMFLAGATGEYGGVAWVTGAPDLDTLEDAENRVNTDPEFVALVDRLATAYLPGAKSSMPRRLA